MKKLIAATALTLAAAGPAAADPAVGFGLNFTFGNGQVNTGLGLRVFSDDQRDKTVASLGLDYMFRSESVRASLGIARLMDRSYVEVNAGYDFAAGAVNLGVGLGGTKTSAPAAAGGGGGGGGGLIVTSN